MPKLLTRFSTYTLLVALSISVVAEFYSIVGLTTIFSAAVIPVIIMGVVLGLGKIMGTVWLKLNWDRAPLTYKLYLIPAIIVLMFLTSMGIFGFLSKAHGDQSLISGDSQAKIAIYDEKINTAKENIDANRKALKQLDEAVDQVMGRSTSEAGADKAVQIRRAQANDRKRLLAEISQEQKTISQLSEESAPLRAENRKIEAEVGPLKYIAAMIYGDDTDKNMIESAVRWVIIIIVAVFDPLALVLLLAAQQSFRWERQRDLEEEEAAKKDSDRLEEEFEASRIQSKLMARELDREVEQHNITAANALVSEIERETPEVVIPPPVVDLAAEANAKIAEIEREVPEVFIDKVDSPKFSVEISPNEWPEQTKVQPLYEQDDGPLSDEQVTQLKEKVALFAPVGELTPKSVLIEESDPTINCYKCGTELINAPGIGPFCPNKSCDVMDGPFIAETPVVINYIPPEPIMTVDEVLKDNIVYTTETVTASSNEITVDSTEVNEPEVIIETENVTAEKQMFDPNSSHVVFDGKKMSIDNLRSIRPDLIRSQNDSFPNKIDFGNEFPKYSVSGDTYIRVDVMPHRVYKFNGTKWMNVEKNENTTYLSNSQYLQFLINKLEQGKYDPEFLTNIERDEIELFLVKKN